MARKMKRPRTECEPRYALRKSLVQLGTLHLLCFKSRLTCRGSSDDMSVEETTPPRRSSEVQRCSTKKNKNKVYTSHIMLKSSSQQAAHDFALLDFSIWTLELSHGNNYKRGSAVPGFIDLIWAMVWAANITGLSTRVAPGDTGGGLAGPNTQQRLRRCPSWGLLTPALPSSRAHVSERDLQAFSPSPIRLVSDHRDLPDREWICVLCSNSPISIWCATT